MGWSGGTEIFDAVVSELRDLSHRWVAKDYHVDFMEPLKTLVIVLEDQDWDTLNESAYWDHPVIGKILGNNDPNEDDYEGEY